MSQATHSATATSTSRRAVTWVLRILVAAGLLIDGYIHLHLAGDYQQAQPGGIGEGTLFRLEGIVALVIAVLVLVWPRRAAYLLAALVGIGGAVAVVLYRYVDVPAFGPIPTMYEPIWFFEKWFSAAAEAIAGLLALLLVFRR